jgi:hypothetical protein
MGLIWAWDTSFKNKAVNNDNNDELGCRVKTWPTMKDLVLKTLLLIICLLAVSVIQARGVYQEPEQFLDQVFQGDVPEVYKLWIERDMVPEIRDILGRDLGALRVSYWQREQRTAWILEEIGKTLPITVGIVVNDNNIETVKILIFRETRGWEVRYPFFTDQFTGLKLAEDDELDEEIDGISGATLSVSAVKRLAALALYFHRIVNQ